MQDVGFSRSVFALTKLLVVVVVNQFAGLLQGVPDAESGFAVELFHMVEQLGDGAAVGVVLVGATLYLLLVAAGVGVCLDVVFVAEAEWSDDGQRHFLHLEPDEHALEAALEELVEQGGVDDVVHVVAEGYFVAMQRLCEVENLLAAVPGTQKAGRLLFVEQLASGG